MRISNIKEYFTPSEDYINKLSNKNKKFENIAGKGIDATFEELKQERNPARNK